MNILFLNRGPVMPTYGGIQRVSKALSDYFSRIGYHVEHLSTFTIEESEVFYPIKKRNLKYIENQYFLPYKLVLGEKPSHENIKFFLNFLEDRKIDLVINNGGLTPLLSDLAYFSKLSGRKIGLISVIHSTIIDKFNNFGYIKEFKLRKRHLSFLLPILKNKVVVFLIKKLYAIKVRSHFLRLCNNSDRVVMLSQYLLPEMKSILGMIPNNVVTINNPYASNIDACEIPQKQHKLLWVGRVDEGKRLDFFIKIWERIFKQFPDWSVDILGDGPMLNICRQYVCDNKIERINFRGFVEPEDYYKEASIFCFTTVFEGFGLVILEAMSSYCVPISFNSFASVSDLIDDSVNGILINSFDVPQYAKKLEQLMCDDALRNELAFNAFKKAKNFSIDNIGSQWVKQINEILK